jgi:hypothetical protein
VRRLYRGDDLRRGFATENEDRAKQRVARELVSLAEHFSSFGEVMTLQVEIPYHCPPFLVWNLTLSMRVFVPGIWRYRPLF